MENYGKDHEDALKDVEFREQPARVDLSRLAEIADTEKAASQMQYFVKHSEYRRANNARLLSEELGHLSQQREEIEQKKQQIMEEDQRHNALKCSSQESSDLSHDEDLEEDAEHDSTPYWKRRALRSEKAHEASLQRERSLEEKLGEYLKKFQPETLAGEFSAMLKRADYFLHLILQSAPIVIAHQDVIGKTDHEILSGEGIDEMNKVKREVMAKGIPTKREFVFNTPLFGAKTFVVYIEPVFSKIGETIGVNYVGLDITDQVKTREKMTDIRVREAVQKAKETEHSRSLNITEDTPQAKQTLATMSHEIGSPLSEVLRIAELLATTKLDQEQHQLLELMLSFGNVVLQSIDGILGFSKVESGVMKLQSAIFRPREVVEHVLQTASSFMKKELTLEGCVGDDVPSEVIGDARKIQEILTNLISFSNAVKFTQDGKVGINLNVVDKQQLECQIEHIRPHFASPINTETEYYPAWPENSDKDTLRCSNREDAHQNGIPSNENSTGEAVWLRFNVYDTGIGIPEKSLPFLFKRYMHANEEHTTKYGGTGLGLAVCKQLVDLMGGTLTVLSKENEGSTFTVMLPCTIPDNGQNSPAPGEGQRWSRAEAWVV
ncbi:probable histidine kinase 1 [Hordeum vulgare subsp. vulgare]|uniref:probable histidine kinase 1 n=1 Tax=Hordeum vulgare subsp. vulgare TaxID=112509 RepID=UPI001D1A446F|nr:probable histidine kinase 1 [Hordeum vulgare subsp. vulgare]